MQSTQPILRVKFEHANIKLILRPQYVQTLNCDWKEDFAEKDLCP